MDCRFWRRMRRRRAGGGIPGRPRTGRGLWPVFLLAVLLLFMAVSGAFLKELSSQIAISDAKDAVTYRINRIVHRLMESSGYAGASFVTFEKNDRGEVTAVNSDMSRINGLSARILDEIVGGEEPGELTVHIPLGNLTGVSLLMGRGPVVPVKIIVLTSSRVEFNNSIVTAGINQTKHQINLHVIVDIDILIPWGIESSQVATDVLIADTVVVGQVPETYLSTENTGKEN